MFLTRFSRDGINTVRRKAGPRCVPRSRGDPVCRFKQAYNVPVHSQTPLSVTTASSLRRASQAVSLPRRTHLSMHKCTSVVSGGGVTIVQRGERAQRDVSNRLCSFVSICKDTQMRSIRYISLLGSTFAGVAPHSITEICCFATRPAVCSLRVQTKVRSNVSRVDRTVTNDAADRNSCQLVPLASGGLSNREFIIPRRRRHAHRDLALQL